MPQEKNDIEEWKSVPDYEGYYEVSSFGRFKRLARTYYAGTKYQALCHKPTAIIYPKPSSHGYLHMVLCKDRECKPVLLHRIICQTFIPNLDNKPCVNHINGIKTDNRLENLEWVTYSENATHAYKTGLKKGALTGKFGKDHHLSIPLLQCDLNGVPVKEWENRRCAERELEYPRNTIGNLLKKGRPYKGFVWKYANNA